MFQALEVFFPPELPQTSLRHLAACLTQALLSEEIERDEILARLDEVFEAGLEWALLENPVPKNHFYAHELNTTDVVQSQLGSIYASWGHTLLAIFGAHSAEAFTKFELAVKADPDQTISWFLMGNEQFFKLTIGWNSLSDEERQTQTG